MVLKKIALTILVLFLIFLISCSNKKVLIEEKVSSNEKIITTRDESLKVIIPSNTFQNAVLKIYESSGKKNKVGNLIKSYEIIATENLSKNVTLEFKVPQNKIKKNETLEENFVVMVYDEENKVYVEVPAEYDEKNGIVRVKTDHFSLWSLVGFEDYHKAVSEHFIIRFKEVNGYGFGAKEIFGYVAKVRSYLEEAYQRYVDAGFKAPKHKISVYVVPEMESYYNPYTGNIIISSFCDKDNDTLHEIAHELFHIFQNQEMSFVKMGRDRWFIEATADYAASRIAFYQNVPERTIKKNYTQFPITRIDGNHEYATALFFDYLKKEHGITFQEIWDIVAESTYAHKAEYILDQYLKENYKTDLMKEYFFFVNYLVFNKDDILKLSKSLSKANSFDHYIVDPYYYGDFKQTFTYKFEDFSTKVITLVPKIEKDEFIRVSFNFYESPKSLNGQVYFVEKEPYDELKYLGDIYNKRKFELKLRKDNAVYIIINSMKGTAKFNLSAEKIKPKASIPLKFKQEHDFNSNIIDLSYSGEISGEVDEKNCKIQTVKNYFGDYQDVTCFFKTSNIPLRVELKPKYSLSKGTTWKVEKDETEYYIYNLSNVGISLTHKHISKDCELVQPKSEIIKDSWSIDIDYEKCSLKNLLTLQMTLVFNYTITTYKREKVGNSFEYRKTYSKQDSYGIQILTLSLNSNN